MGEKTKIVYIKETFNKVNKNIGLKEKHISKYFKV